MSDMVEQPNEQTAGGIQRPPLVLVHPDTGSTTHASDQGPHQAVSAPPSSLPPLAIALSICTFLTGVGVIAFYARQLPHSGLVGLILLTLMAAVAERLSILLYDESKVSISLPSLRHSPF